MPGCCVRAWVIVLLAVSERVQEGVLKNLGGRGRSVVKFGTSK